MDITGLQELKVEEVNHISSCEPSESYFRASATKSGIKGYGIGETMLEAIVDCLDWIDSCNAKIVFKFEELENEFPF